MDRYRDQRSPERGRYVRDPAAADTYVPGNSVRGTRPRSRSPAGYRRPSPPRMQTDTWRGRPRSPPPSSDRYEPRDAFPPRDGRPRSPRRNFGEVDTRYDGRGLRARSPLPAVKRGYSPNGRPGRPSPLPKREQVDSTGRDFVRQRSPPRRGYSPPRDKAAYKPRSRSPMRRNEQPDPYTAKTWRRRSQSPRDASGRNSSAASRRTSPRRRIDSTEINGRSPPSRYRRTSPSPRARSPPPFRQEPDPYNSHPRDYPANGDTYGARNAEPLPPPVPDYRDRPPPSGPSGSRPYGGGGPPMHSPPTGPSSTPVSISAHNHGGQAPPTGPYSRGGGGYRGRGGGGPPHRDYPGGPSPRRASYGGPGGYGRGGRGGGGGPPTPHDPYPARDPYAPRPDPSYDRRGPPPPRRQDPSDGPLFRGSANSTSTTYPRTQRFNTGAYLADLPVVKPGGERLPPLHAADTSKADKLEEEAARLRKMIDERELSKRKGVREWERLERESESAGVRSELAEESLRGLSGEGSAAAAF